MSSLLQVKNLQTSFVNQGKIFKAVKGIDFSISKGEILGIVGESGSGKSVSAYAILKLLPQKSSKISGQILFSSEESVDLNTLSESEIRHYRGNKIAMIFQEPMSSLNPTMKCGAQVLEMILLHTNLNKIEAKQKVISLFEKVRLPDPERIYNAYPHQISGGQIQRVMIAMAVSADPDILIADEPTTALDVTVQKEILELLREIQSELGTATIFISHDLSLVKKLCNHVLVMYKGQLVEQGTAQEIFNNPKQDYTKGLIACRPQNNFGNYRLPTVQDFMDGKKMDQQIVEKIEFGSEILKVNNLKKWYPKEKNWRGKPLSYTKAVDGVSFNLKEKEILGIVGESGCGKSTLGKMLANLLAPDSGKIFFKETDISTYEKRELKSFRRNIQMIFQDPYGSLNPRMRIGDAIGEPVIAHRMVEKSKVKNYVCELLEKTGLDSAHYDRFPHEFSGGQRQRIVIARALALKPKLLICDECISALDVSVQAQIINLLLDLRRDMDLSMIFIAHDLAATRFISDRILVMNDGVIAEIGDADEVYLNPKNAYSKRLLAAVSD